MAKKTKKVEIVTVEDTELEEGSSTIHYWGTVDVNVTYDGNDYILKVKISADANSYEGNAPEITSVEVEELDEVEARGKEPEDDSVFEEIEKSIDWKKLTKAIEDSVMG